MSAPLYAPASDTRPTVVQQETNADRPRPLSAIRTVADLRERLKVTPPGKVLRVLATAPLSPRCKALLQALWCRAVWRSGEVHPSTSEGDLLTDTAMDRRTLYRAMADLEKAGFVDRKRAYGRHRAQYTLPWVCGQKTAEAATNRVSPTENRVTQDPGIGCHLACAKEVLPLPLPLQPSELQPPPPPALPPTPEPRREAAGGTSRLRSKADGRRQLLTNEAEHVKAFLAIDCGMWSQRADSLSRSGTTLEAAQIAWAEVKASDRTVKPHALWVRLSEDPEGYERQAVEKREEDRIEAERERRKPELDRNLVNAKGAWAQTKKRDWSLAKLLTTETGISLSKVQGCGTWFWQEIVGGETPLGNGVRGPRGRERALLRLLRNGTAPKAVVSAVQRAYPVVAPQHLAEAIQAWHAVREMPQTAG